MRPAGSVRFALVQALFEGAVGTFDALAVHAGVTPAQAQHTLSALRREGKVEEHGPAQAKAKRGRPRLVYRLASTPPIGRHWELDRTLRSVWR